jgi:hypothetical protein
MNRKRMRPREIVTVLIGGLARRRYLRMDRESQIPQIHASR